VDILLIVSDPSIRGITAAAHTKDLIGEMRSSVSRIGLIVNKVRDGIPIQIRQAADEAGLDIIAAIREDANMLDLEANGRPLIDLPADSPLRLGVEELAASLDLISVKG
jgi:CO dehydrogenase maturation factor